MQIYIRRTPIDLQQAVLLVTDRSTQLYRNFSIIVTYPFVWRSTDSVASLVSSTPLIHMPLTCSLPCDTIAVTAYRNSAWRFGF